MQFFQDMTHNPFLLTGLLAGLLASLARRQVARLDSHVRHRTELAQEFEAVLRRKGAGVPEIDTATMQPAWLRFPFWVEDLQGWTRRLRAAGIECHRYVRWFEAPIHPRESAENPLFGYEPGTCPRAEWLSQRILNLPTSPRIGRWLVQRVARL